MKSVHVWSMKSFMEEFNSLSKETLTSRDLSIEATRDTPSVQYRSDKSETLVIGKCMTEDAEAFFKPVIARIKDDLTTLGSTNVTFFFNSFGPKTAKVLFDLFAYFRLSTQCGKKINLTWKSTKYNLDMLELGDSLAELFDLDIKLICEQS